MPLTDVPLSSQTLADTQPLVRSNFATINTAFAVDHVPYVGPNQGKHNHVTFPVQAGSPAVLANELVFYTKDVAGTPQAFYKRDTGVEVDFTSTSLALNGQTTLPSGLIIKWGQTNGGTLVGNSWTQVIFPLAFPNNCFSVQVSPKVVTPQPSVAETTTLLDLNTTFAVNGFYVFNRRTDAGPGIAADCTYFAIGN